ncbi:MAG: hypothetical protein DCC67_15455 [Planctomycetota bacterium]|nr:MAG: hypothetical protein DCC67_15455 [Planctomycetota bacterium]
MEPLAIDEALADAATVELADRHVRCDGAESFRGGAAVRGDARRHAHAASIREPDDDEALLRSLSAQLDELAAQQHELRRLLDAAGRRRMLTARG